MSPTACPRTRPKRCCGQTDRHADEQADRQTGRQIWFTDPPPLPSFSPGLVTISSAPVPVGEITPHAVFFFLILLMSPTDGLTDQTDRTDRPPIYEPSDQSTLRSRRRTPASLWFTSTAPPPPRSRAPLWRPSESSTKRITPTCTGVLICCPSGPQRRTRQPGRRYGSPGTSLPYSGQGCDDRWGIKRGRHSGAFFFSRPESGVLFLQPRAPVRIVK